MSLVLAQKKLERQEGQTSFLPVECGLSLEALEKELAGLSAPAKAVIWQQHRLIFGRWEEGKLSLADGSPLEAELILELRVFNEQEELHLVRSGEKLTGRLAQDGAGEQQSYVDSISPLWGKTSGEAPAGYARLKDEDRQLELVVPVSEQGSRYGLVTRNYIMASPLTYQAGYGDYRYVSITATREVK